MHRLRRSFLSAVLIGCALVMVGCSDSSNPTGTSGGDSGGQFNSQAEPGTSAEAFLDDDSFTALRVEVDFMEGHEPTEAALDSLEARLGKHLAKSSISIEAPSRISAGGQSNYSTEEIRALEDEHRDQFTDADDTTIWAYALILDGKFENENVLGLAYFNTSLALFGETVDEISGGATQPSTEKVEATVLLHEFGHLLGLVNNGTPMQQDHHDEENGPHCTEDACVMRHEIETSDLFGNVFGGTIPEFEQFGTEDMAAQRGE